MQGECNFNAERASYVFLVALVILMPPKTAEHAKQSPSMKPAADPKSPRCSPKVAPLPSPQLKSMHSSNTKVIIPVNSDLVGVLIGKEGKTLHRIERMFSVTMRVSRDASAQGHELCTVDGSDGDNVAMCETYIHSICHPEVELLLPEGGLVIPKRLSGRFIGARGSNKEMFEKKSGAVIEYDEDKTKVLIKGTQKAVAAAGLLVRKFIFDELLPKRKLGLEEHALALEADKVGIHLNMNQLDTFSKSLKETYTLALKSFAAEDAQFSVLMKKQGIRWTWRLCSIESAEFVDIPCALALELERFFIDGSDGGLICLPDTSVYDVSLSNMSVCNRNESSRYQLHRNCPGPTLYSSRSASSSDADAPTFKKTDAKAADLSHRIMQYGFQHREITICLRNGCVVEMDALLSALTDLQACTWLSNSAAQNAKKTGSTAAYQFSGGLVPMFVKPQLDNYQKIQPQQHVANRRPVVLDGSNIALRHGTLYFPKSFHVHN